MVTLRSYPVQVRSALRSSVATRQRATATIGLAITTFVLLVLSSFPLYSWQLLSASITYLPEAVSALTWNTYASTGALGLGLIALYAALTGPAIVTMYVLLRQHGWTAVTGAGNVAPGFLVSGCVGCGAGFLGLFGFIGAAAMLPFDGNGVRLLGIGLILFYLGRVGDPATCDL